MKNEKSKTNDMHVEIDGSGVVTLTSPGRVHPLVMRPGKGWKRLSGPVWEHTTGLRIHTLGMLRMPDGRTVSASLNNDTSYYMRMCDGNTKRGMMVWALNYLAHNTQ